MKLFSTLLVTAFSGLGQVNAFAPTSVTNQKNVHYVAESRAAFGVLNPLVVPKVTLPRRSTAIFMGWGPDPIWSSARVSAISPACPSESCVNLVLEVSAETAEGYTVPGQYVQMKIAGDDDAQPIFLAIASPPQIADEGEPTFMEFLIKKTENNGWITSANEGDTVDVSQVLGNGFPMDENFEGFKYDFPTQNVLLFATGSGIAPIRAVIESGQLSVGAPGEGGRTARLYYGIQTTADMPYAERFGIWERSGVQVVPVISQPENCKYEWEGRTGYVQNALEEDGVPIPRNSGALLCGVKGMTESVKDILSQAGVFEGRLLTNF